MRRLFAACLALAAFAGPAMACINDEELPNHEREFRSQYASRSSPVVVEPASPVASWLLIGGGATLLACGTALALVGRRSKD